MRGRRLDTQEIIRIEAGELRVQNVEAEKNRENQLERPSEERRVGEERNLRVPEN